MLSTVLNTQRFTELHREEKREGGDGGDQDENRGIKSGESNLASKQIPMCSAPSGTLREVHGVTLRRERKEIEVTRRGGEVKRRETDLASNQFPKFSPQPGTYKEIHRVKWRKEGEGRR